MKKEIGIYVLFLIFMIGFVSADECNNSQTIMKLSYQNNSHGYLWSYNPPTTPDACTGTPESCSVQPNSVQCADAGCTWTGGSSGVCSGSSPNPCSSFNSRSEIICTTHGCAWDNSIAPIPILYSVCYNEIFGTDYTEPNPNTCTGTNKILNLYYSNNSHASVDNKTGYNIPVCFGNLVCANRTTCNANERAVVSLSNNYNAHTSVGNNPNYPIKICCAPGTALPAFWADMNEDPIISSPVNAYVKMGVYSSGTIIYTVEKKNGNSWNFVINVSKTANTGTTFGVWFADASGIYRFRAGNSVSNDLNVSGERDSTIPEVDFVSPACGSDFFINDTVEIVVNVTDRYDPIGGTIDFGDGTNTSLSPGINTFTHKYTANGTKKIIADVTDLNPAEGFGVKKVNNIIIIDRTASARYLAGCIASPKNAERLNTNTVRFNASTTRLLSFNAVAQTKTNLNLSTDAIFTWTLSDIGSTTMTIVFKNDSYIKTHSVQGLIENRTSGAMVRGYDFSVFFPSSGNNWAKLSVDFV